LRVMNSIFIAIQLGLCFSLVQAADLFNSNGCGVEKLCERRPGNCQNSTDCNLLFSSRPLNDNQIEFELWAPGKLQGGEELNYLAVGFSKDTKMGDDAVTFCYKLPNGESGIGTGKTIGKSFTPSTEQNSDLVELKEVRGEDNQFYCKFVQTVNKGSDDLLKPDLSQGYHILIVRGTTADGKILNIHSFGQVDGPYASGTTHTLTAIPVATSSNTKSNASPTSNTNPISNTTESIPLLIRFHGTFFLNRLN